MNVQITQNFVQTTFANSDKCYQHCKSIPANDDPQFFKCLDQCNSQYVKVLDFIHSSYAQMQTK